MIERVDEKIDEEKRIDGLCRGIGRGGVDRSVYVQQH